MKQLLFLSVFNLVFAFAATAQKTIAIKDAPKHIGETVKICDKIYSSKVTSANTTSLYLGGNYPNQALTVMLTSANKDKFNKSLYFTGKDFTVTGKLVNYEGRPAIVLKNPNNLKVVMIDDPTTLMLSTSF